MKWRQSGYNGMCMAHSIEALNPAPVAQTCTVCSTGAEHVMIKKSYRADECLTQSNGDGGATRGTGRSPDGSGETPYSPVVVHGDAEDFASAVNHATRKPPWTVQPPARVVDMSDNRPKPTFEDVYRLFGTDDGDDSDRFYLSSI